MNYKEISSNFCQTPSKIADSEFISLEGELNSLLAEEYQAWYQYWSVFQFLAGNERQSVQDKLIELGKDELDDHAAKLLNRISELNMTCYLQTPESWKEYAKSEFKVPNNIHNIPEILSLNLNSELEAINHYQEVIDKALELKDYTTADLLKEILADEEEHRSVLQDFINDINA